MGTLNDPAVSLGVGLLVVGGLVACFWPGWGLLARWQRSRAFHDRVYREDGLKHVYGLELEGRSPTLQSLAGTLEVPLSRAADVVAALQRKELVEVVGEELRLTPTGRRYALNVLRAHRLWEKHLAENTGVAESEWHRLAERQEHMISPKQVDTLAAELGNPAFDPHGDPIPTAEGEFARREGRPLTSLRPNEWARVSHVEDEPETVCAQIRAVGLYPGTLIRVLEASLRRVRVWANGEEHILAPVVAANVTVRPVAPVPAEKDESDCQPLSNLTSGRAATVARLSPQCRGAERRRLLDFGILPGTRIEVEMLSPTGNLTAYRVRDTLIALRREQASQIYVNEEARS